MFNAVFFWALMGFLLIGSEMLIPGFTIFFFGLGALLTSLLCAIIPGLKSNIALQILLWAVSSSSSLIFLRKYLTPIFKGTLIHKDFSEEMDTGETAIVLEDILPDKPGRIKYHGTSWKAVSYDETLKKDEKVEILKKEDLTYIVTKSISGELTD